MQPYLRPFSTYYVNRITSIGSWNITKVLMESKHYWHIKNQNYPWSQTTILCHVRRFQFWNWYSTFTITSGHKQNEFFISNFKILNISRAKTTHNREGTPLKNTLTEYEKVFIIAIHCLISVENLSSACVENLELADKKLIKKLILGSKHPTVICFNQKPIIVLFTQKINPIHRRYRIQKILRKFLKLHII